MLKRRGWRKIVPRPNHPKNNKKRWIVLKNFPQMVQNSLIEAKEKGLCLKVMFQDEARFGRINDPKRCWCRAKFRAKIGKQIVREYVYAYGDFCPSDGAADFLILPYIDAKNMNVFLSELSVRYPNELILLICDKAPCHSSGVLEVPNNIKLLHLSAYCPQLNPSENMWEEMREKFLPILCSTQLML
ncbi:MAG: transposase [Rickettsiales bacterium]|jgi:hypothetical protein|nr:transposase [Rickettsiales bacterium]